MYNVNILGSGYIGIYVGSYDLENVVIESFFICYLVIYGIKVVLLYILLLNVFNCLILDNNYGIFFDLLFGSIIMEDIKISNLIFYVLYINVFCLGGLIYYLINSSVIYCKGFGIVINGYYGNLRFVVIGIFFGWNN